MIRHLPFKDVRDLYMKCTCIINELDRMQQSNKELLTASGADFTQIGPIGFIFDASKNNMNELEKTFFNPTKDMIEILLQKNGVEPIQSSETVAHSQFQTPTQ